MKVSMCLLSCWESLFSEHWKDKLHTVKMAEQVKAFAAFTDDDFIYVHKNIDVQVRENTVFVFLYTP